ncbi:MAG: hypothetical protein HZA54_02220 [Planctomycetes bacterium]|nr:hypothetical protein [Planctomycetota bacterium]
MDLGSAEDALRRDGIHQYSLRGQTPSRHDVAWERLVAEWRANLVAAKNIVGFARLVLGSLIEVDRRLKNAPPDLAGETHYQGLDGRTYRLGPSNAYLAEVLEDAAFREPSWERHEGRSLRAYARHHVAVPLIEHAGAHLSRRARSDWGGSFLHQRLHNERKGLRVMLWPFKTHLEYTSLKLLKATPRPSFLTLDSIANEADLLKEVLMAVEEGVRRKTTLLIFPELTIPPTIETTLKQRLQSHDPGGHPMLTLFGCTHLASGTQGQVWNECVLLGPTGVELHRHRKLVPYDNRKDPDHPVGENLETGSEIAILESSVGNLVPLICADFINGPLQDLLCEAHGNLFAVPSLSPKISAHDTAARNVRQRLLASSFVSNRTLLAADPSQPFNERASFYLVAAAPKQPRVHDPARGHPSFLEFDLELLLVSP